MTWKFSNAYNQMLPVCSKQTRMVWDEITQCVFNLKSKFVLPPAPVYCFFRDSSGNLACVAAGDGVDPLDAIEHVTEALEEDNEVIKSPVLALIQGGKK